MKKRERDIETWKDIVEELDLMLDSSDGRTHGQLIRGWLIDQRVELGLEQERPPAPNPNDKAEAGRGTKSPPPDLKKPRPPPPPPPKKK